MTLLIAVAAAAGVLTGAVKAQTPHVTLSNVKYTSGCRTALGPPSSTFSPDNRSISILFHGPAAERRTTATRREIQVECRVSVDAQMPAGMEGRFKAADYRYALLTSGGGSAQLSVRHGRKAFLFNRWTDRAIKTSEPLSGETIAPSGGAVTIGCGQKKTLLIEVTLRARGATNTAEAVATLDSIDFDPGLPAHVDLAPCR